MNKEELKRLEEIKEIQERNLLVFSQVALYLNDAPCTVTREIIEEITGGSKSLEEYSYVMFLANIFTDDNKLANELLREYYVKSVKKLDEQEYYNNPYYKNIKIPNKKIGKWTLGYQSYKPYEAFIRDDIIRDGYKEIPRIGYFDKEFTFPTVFENDIEWMAIKPNEIETMKKPIQNAKGNTLVYGLGLGYFAYMISLKEEVSNITIIERDESVIALFEGYILPQFVNKHKIKIIRSDAFDYAKKAGEFGYDYVFVDLWHDVSDGVELYIKMKKYEENLQNAQFDYWIEESILSSARARIFDAIYKKIKGNNLNKSIDEIDEILQKKYLKNFLKNF